MGALDRVSSKTGLARGSDLGRLLRARREEAGLGVHEAAAWLGVGSRFLLELEGGKPKAQLGLALQVARRLGVEITARRRTAGAAPMRDDTTGVAVEPHAPTAAWIDLKVPPAHSHGLAVLALRHAGLSLLKDSGLPVPRWELVRPAADAGKIAPVACIRLHDDGLGVPCLKYQTYLRRHIKVAPASPAAAPPQSLNRPNRTLPHWACLAPGPGVRQEDGGLGLAGILQFLDEEADIPVLMLERVIRWVVLSTMMVDTEINAASIPLRRDTRSGALALGTFSASICATPVLAGEGARASRGLKIGRDWPEQYLRVDHWSALAKDAGVHPKVVFNLIQAMAPRVPGVMEQALMDFYGAAMPTRGPIIEAIYSVRQRADRMADLVVAAPRQRISGLETKTRPAPTVPVARQASILEPKRFRTTLVDADIDGSH